MTAIRFHEVSYAGDVLRTVAAGSLAEAVEVERLWGGAET